MIVFELQGDMQGREDRKGWADTLQERVIVVQYETYYTRQ